MTVEQFLKQDERKTLLRLLTAGSVDDGKSTLIGRLLFDSKQLYDDQLSTLERDSERCGNSKSGIDYALLCDGLRAEREQGITIDVAYRYFATARRKFIIADTPGHEQYTRNMITGGSTAELAIILVDARQGIVTQTRRHSYIVSLLGIKDIVLAINKMDLVDYNQDIFDTIVTAYHQYLRAQSIEFSSIQPIPISALYGENIVTQSTNMPWYSGLPLLAYLESVEIDRGAGLTPFRLPVQYVLHPDQHLRGFAGRVSSGVLHRGDSVTAHPSGQRSTIESIFLGDKPLDRAVAQQSVTVTLSDQIDLSRGEMLSITSQKNPHITHTFEAMVVWMDEMELDNRKSFYLKHTTNTLRATISDIRYAVDINTGNHKSSDTLCLNQIASVEITCSAPIICDRYSENRQTGSFIIIDPLTHFTSAVGMITRPKEDSDRGHFLTSISLSESGISAEHREAIERFISEIELRTGITIECKE